MFICKIYELRFKYFWSLLDDRDEKKKRIDKVVNTCVL